MEFKFLKAFLAGTALSFASVATAGLIQADYETSNDNLATYDKSTGLTWLDFTVTKGNSYADVASISGWRVATNSEVETLISNNFTDPDYNTDGYMNVFDDSLEFDEAAAFAGMFGVTFGYYSHGIYLDENATLRMAGVDTTTGKYTIFGEDYTRDYSSYASNFHPALGVYMVKEAITDVPEPTTLAIFALGLAGLTVRRFNK